MTGENREGRQIVEPRSGPQNAAGDPGKRQLRSPALAKDVEVHGAEQRQEQFRRQILRGAVEAGGPAGDRYHRESVAHDVENRPLAPVGEKNRAGYEYRFVNEERNLSISTGRQQERRRK